MTTPARRGPLPDSVLRVGVAQVAAVPGAVEHNVDTALSAARAAADAGASLVVLPELHIQGYHLPTLLAQPGDVLDAGLDGVVADHRLDPLTAAPVTVLCGAATRRPDGGVRNSLLLLVPGQAPRVVYDKRFLWRDEREVFVPGSDVVCLDIGDWRLGLGICYDVSFPEHARASAVAGAQAYLCPSAFVVGADTRAATYLAARALENTIFTVFANSVDGPPDRLTGGRSAVFGPQGAVLSRADSAAATLVTDLDPDAVRRARDLLWMLDDLPADQARPVVRTEAATLTGRESDRA
ncbi:carbon-nitrogen hydrolase family protein [Actinokineospora diospyrosa]|uniref:Amidohydrolase n=1 Tax=Actinokineospora diospyrosa TaxID=103728 RepID=A0ABT1IJI3_9PSEU|nr:carbon-nitrogen hydrolase family protein [Actinokineospora diospyrosa]MCP2272703.1 putative amidohydrolase [Actinokineospora diospyrosa]